MRIAACEPRCSTSVNLCTWGAVVSTISMLRPLVTHLGQDGYQLTPACPLRGCSLRDGLRPRALEPFQMIEFGLRMVTRTMKYA